MSSYKQAPIELVPRRHVVIAALVASLLLVSAGADGGGLPPQTVASMPMPIRYARSEYLIPMRDGVRLDTVVYEPLGSRADYPIILERTPYDIHGGRPPPSLAAAGYIFAFQSVRGRYESQGSFILMTPELTSHARPDAVDASTDSYDTIKWLVKYLPHNNRRVGLIGNSYPGFYAVAGMIDAPPELKVVSPQAPQADWFVGDDVHHHGAFLLDSTFGFVARCLHRVAPPSASTQCNDSGYEVYEPDGFNYGTPNGYDFFLSYEPLPRLTNLLQGNVPGWMEVMDHGTYDPYWRSRDILPHIRDVKPAVLDVGGWYDANDFYGTLHVSESLARQSPGTPATLVIGPWYHGQWWEERSLPSDLLKSAWPPVEYYQEHVFLPFLAHYLKGAPDPRLPRALVFDTGQNAWQRFDRWPPAHVEQVHLYLHAGEQLNFESPTAAEPSAFDQYVSDPKSPVPYTPVLGTDLDNQYMVRDQRFLGRRPDVLVYESEPLTSDVTVAGPIVVRLFASTSGTDSDWIVRLIDVSPQTAPAYLPDASQLILPGDQSDQPGFELLVRGDAMRGKFRESLEHPAPMVPGRATPITFTMDDVFHTFQQRHRIIVQVQSTWFPRVDLNPQTFTDIYSASAGDFRPATERIYHSTRYPSSLVFGVIPSPHQAGQ